MKKMLKVIVSIILTLSILTGTAFACSGTNNYYSVNYGTVVATDGSSYIRTAPNLDAVAIGCLELGCAATYCGCSEIDWRGVRWDYIYYNGVMGWISSRYTTLYM